MIPTLNWEIVAAFVILALIVGVFVHKFLAQPSATAVASVASGAKKAVDVISSDAQKAAHFIGTELHFSHPAAPAPSVADAPPPSSVAPAEAIIAAPAAGGGGTPIAVTASDAVVANHAQLDALIAAGKQAEADKAALSAAQDALNKLVA